MKETTKWYFSRAGLYARKVNGIKEFIFRDAANWQGWKWYRVSGMKVLPGEEMYKTAAAAMRIHPDEVQS